MFFNTLNHKNKNVHLNYDLYSVFIATQVVNISLSTFYYFSNNRLCTYTATNT